LPVSEIAREQENPMHRTRFRNILTHKLAATALPCIYGLAIIGASALLLGASSTSAFARGGHGGGFHGGGFHGGGFHGRGFGLGYYPYGYGYYGGYYPPYYGDAGVCYSVRRRVMTRYGWRIRRVSVCE
jgi:hypothetical protein